MPGLLAVALLGLLLGSKEVRDCDASSDGIFSDHVAVGQGRVDRGKRELPGKVDCNPGSNRDNLKCYKGDLIDQAVADCKRFTKRPCELSTCDPINRVSGRVVDIPDESIHGVTCKPNHDLQLVCGEMGSNTRCVCDTHLLNECRCQYWPADDVRASRPSFCTQRDHGGKTGIHFFACCNNCNDPTDRSCDGTTYQGGGSTASYCNNCGEPVFSSRGRETYKFNCGSCAVQEHCRKMCNRNPFSKCIPGLCPAWIGCFRDCCVAAHPSYRGRRSDSGGLKTP